MSHALAILLLGLLPMPGVVRDEAHAIEINTVVNDDGDTILRQCIWWDIRGNVIDWRQWEERYRPLPMPGGGWRQLFVDRECMREIRAQVSYITITRVDPEVANRAILDPQFRRKLAQVREPHE